MIYLAHSVLSWSLWGSILAFGIAPALLFPLGMFLLGKFSYNKKVKSKGFGIFSIVLGFVIPIVGLVVKLLTQ